MSNQNFIYFFIMTKIRSNEIPCIFNMKKSENCEAAYSVYSADQFKKNVFKHFLGLYNCSLRVLAHEKLGELLQVLRAVVDKYPEIDSEDILSMASELIKHVKGRD